MLMERGDRKMGYSGCWQRGRELGSWEGRSHPEGLSVLAGLVPSGPLRGQCSWVVLGWPHCQA